MYGVISKEKTTIPPEAMEFHCVGFCSLLVHSYLLTIDFD